MPLDTLQRFPSLLFPFSTNPFQMFNSFFFESRGTFEITQARETPISSLFTVNGGACGFQINPNKSRFRCAILSCMFDRLVRLNWATQPLLGNCQSVVGIRRRGSSH